MSTTNKLKPFWLNDIPSLSWKTETNTIQFFECKGWSQTRYYCCIPDSKSLSEIISTIQSELRTTKRVWIVIYVDVDCGLNVKLGFNHFKKLVKENKMEDCIFNDVIAEYGEPIYMEDEYYNSRDRGW